MPQTVQEGSNVFQYAVPSRNAKGKEITAYLWIPADAQKIRGLIIGGDLMMEANFIMDPVIRQACADESLGILFFMKHLYGTFKWQKNDCEDRLADVLERLAEVSNHPELKSVPLLPIGHSAASIAPSQILHWNPERALGAITYKGAHGIDMKKDTAPVRGIPTLHVQDFVEEYKNRKDTGSLGRMNVAEVRAKDPLVLSGILEDNGSKHAAWCFRLTPIIAEFIRGTAQLRIRDDGSLQRVKPEEGVLIDKRFGNPRHDAAPAGEYQGDPKEAMWYPTMKMARMMMDYNAVQLWKKPQYIAFVDPVSGKIVGPKSSPRPHWVGPDVFEVDATFLDKTDNPALPQDPVTHADGPIRFAAHGRKLERVGRGRFRLNFHPMAVRWYRLSAYHLGDEEHRFEEAFATMSIPKAKGDANTIEFARIGTVARNDFPLKLQAGSSADAPVHFTVEYGPATVKDGQLHLAEVPAKAEFPMEIAVWAYSSGSYVQPQAQAATPVRQVIQVRE
jgi:hypothetical protein